MNLCIDCKIEEQAIGTRCRDCSISHSLGECWYCGCQVVTITIDWTSLGGSVETREAEGHAKWCARVEHYGP